VTFIGDDAFEFCPNLRLKVYSDSYAQSYAVENDIPYDLIDGSGSGTGDNGAGSGTGGGSPGVTPPVVTPNPTPVTPNVPYVNPDPKPAKPDAKPAAPKKLAAPKAAAGKKQIKVTWKKSDAKDVSGYEVRYRIAGKKWVTKKIGAKTTSLTIKKLKPGKKYEVRVRALKKSGGKTAYGAWSKTIKSGKVKR
jgi:hypothetical protein